MSEQLIIPAVTEKKEFPLKVIQLPFIDLPTEEGRRNTIKKECYMGLFDNYICYKIVGTYEYKDTEGDSTWKEKKANYRWTRPRKNLSDIAMHFDNVFSTWVLCIDFVGVAGDGTSWHFADPKECLKAYETLKEYYITTKF